MALHYKISYVQITLLCVSFIVVSSLPIIQDKRFFPNHSNKKEIKHGLSKLFTNEASLKRSRRFVKGITGSPSNRRRGMLKSKTSNMVGVFPNGTVYGGFDRGDDLAKLELQSYGSSIIRLQSIMTNLYIGMNRRGRPVGMLRKNKRNLWKEIQEKNGFHTFQSLYHSKNITFRGRFFLAIKGSGYPKKGNFTKPGMRSAHFLFLKSNVTK